MSCKECPWVVDSENNRNFTEHSKRHKKKHNCHMVKSEDRENKLWTDTPTHQCQGNKDYLEQLKKEETC